MKTAGESTRQMAKERRKMRRWIGYSGICIVIAGLCVVFVFMAYNKAIVKTWGIFGAIVVMAGMIGIKFWLDRVSNSAFASMDHLRKREKDALRGAEGEVVVGKILEDFTQGRHAVLHDVECPLGNLDHVLLTESGNIFLIETKTHGGEVTLQQQALLLNGKPPEKDFIKQALGNLYWLKGELDRITGQDTRVKVIIVFTNAFVSKHYVVKNISVINKRFLAENLSELNRKPGKVNLWHHAEQIKASLQRRAIPLHPMPPAMFYLTLNGQVEGPFTSEIIKAFLQVGSARADTPCCVEGTDEWQTVGTLVV